MNRLSIIQLDQQSAAADARAGQVAPFPFQTADILPAGRTSSMQHNLKQFLNDNARAEFAALPRKVLYYPLIEDCYNRIFYDVGKVAPRCPGPLRCDLPPVPGLRCAVAQQAYGHTRVSASLMLHYPAHAGRLFINDQGCYT